MKNFLFLLLFLAVFQTTYAQYTEVINSRRPGFTDSPFSVGTDVLQFESGIFYQKINDNTNNLNVSSIGTDVMVRYGKFLEKLEINLNLAFQYDNISFDAPSIDDLSRFGLSQLTIGGKYLVYMSKFKDKSREIRSWKAKNKYDWKRLIPSVAVYAGANIPVTKNYVRGNTPGFIDGKFSPRFAIYTQNDFSDRFVFLMNFVMDKIGSGQKENSYILTGTYSVNDKISLFAEHQGIFKDDNIPNDFQFGLGSAYLLGKDKQVDLSLRRISDRDGSAFLVSAGFAWRIDRHKDQFKLLGSDGKVADDDDKKGFFKRLFSKKDKNEKLRKVKKVKAKKRKIKKLDAPKTSKAEKRRRKAELKKLKKEQKENKKKKKNQDKNYEPPKNDSNQ
jgi:hypothetical protein